MACGGRREIDISTDEFDSLCTVCKGKNKNTEAVKYCTDCHDYYCSTCVKCHDDIPVLKSHQILDKKDFKPGSSVQFPAVPTERCTLHGHQPIVMYCKQHDAVGCYTCMIVQHKPCTEIFYVPEYIRNNTKAVNPRDLETQLDTIVISLVKLRCSIISEKEKLEASKENSLALIEQFRKEINEQLDDLEAVTIRELEEKFESLNEQLEVSLREIRDFLKEIQLATKRLKSCGRNLSQKFVSIKMANSIASLAKEKVYKTASQRFSKEICFVAYQKLESLLNEMYSIGSINEILKISPESPSPVPHVTTSKVSPIACENLSSPSLLQIERKPKYSVNFEGDKHEECSIYSACTLVDGTVILADNRMLKRLDSSSFTVTESLRVGKYPCQICAINEREIAVCCDHNQYVQFVAVVCKMHEARSIHIGSRCRGLAYAAGMLYVSDDISVHIYNLAGNKLQQFSNHPFGRKLFSNICSLSVSSDNSKIFVADWFNGLIILNRKGQLVGQFNSKQLENAHSVCNYKNESVLVCGWSSKNVLQFSTNGKMIGEVLSTSKRCQAVCCNKGNTKLIVGFHMDNEIKIKGILNS